jgi:hypothetical protein
MRARCSPPRAVRSTREFRPGTRHAGGVRLALFVVVAAACRSAPAPALPPAGDERDDGAGVLARASVDLELGADGSAGLDDSPRRRAHTDEFGGTTYGGWHGRLLTPAAHPSRYTVTLFGLDGTIDGVVTWSGTAPHSTCGGLRIGPDHAVRGAAVYIEHVTTGRPFPSYVQTVQVGGTLVKRGCALAPSVQVVAPAPAALEIRGDDTAVRLRVTAAGSASSTVDLQAGGAAMLEIGAGVTKLDGADGALGPAWVIGVETPYLTMTDDDGRFRIDQLPPGVYDLTIFSAPGMIGGAPMIAHRQVRVGAGSPTKLAIALH